MANLTSLLRDEITRLAKRQINAEIVPLKKRWAQQRRVIASLKEECSTLRREVAQLSKRAHQASATQVSSDAGNAGTPRRRFSADGLRAFRNRLGLTVRDLARLLDVSEQTIYNWETASTRPQPAMIDTIARLRALGKRELKARLLELQEAK
jgi:DNA-binding transcriptional regulator YiaG